MFSIQQLETMTLPDLQSAGCDIVDEIQHHANSKKPDLEDLEQLAETLNRCTKKINFSLSDQIGVDAYISQSNDSIALFHRAASILESLVESVEIPEESRLRVYVNNLKERSRYIARNRYSAHKLSIRMQNNSGNE